jgi:Arm DNA-binding domain
MARQTKRLSSRTVSTLNKPGRHADGDGLYLVIDKGGAKRWAFIFRWKASGRSGPGNLREMGLGGISSVSLGEARERAGNARRLLASGQNPIEARKAAEVARHSVTTFGAFAEALAEDLQHGFRSETHKVQWSRTLAMHAASLRDLPLEAIQTSDVLAVLTPMWKDRTETAARLRGRIERVLDAAKAKGLRTGENPARWRGHLDQLLPRRQKLAKRHHSTGAAPIGSSRTNKMSILSLI